MPKKKKKRLTKNPSRNWGRQKLMDFIREKTRTITEITESYVEEKKEHGFYSPAMDKQIKKLQKLATGKYNKRGVIRLGLSKNITNLVKQAKGLLQFEQWVGKEPMGFKFEEERRERAYQSFITDQHIDLSREQYFNLVTTFGEIDFSDWGYEDSKTKSALIGNLVDYTNDEEITKDELIELMEQVQEETYGQGYTGLDKIKLLQEKIDELKEEKREYAYWGEDYMDDEE